MNDLEAALRATLKAHELDIDPSTVRDDLGTTPAQPPRWRALVPVVIGGAVAAVVAFIAYVAWPVDEAPAEQPAVAPTPTSIDPPAPDGGPFRVWLSESVVPAAGADVAVMLIGPPATESSPRETFGVGAQLDRWDGTQWQPHRWVRLCMDFWHCVGSLHLINEEGFGIEDIGIEVGASGTGSTTYLRLEGLDPGWYRLQQTSVAGVQANGVFEVVAADAPVVPVGPRDVDTIAPDRTLLTEADRTVLIRREPATTQPDDSPAYDLGETVDLETWTGQSWDPVTAIALVPAPEEDAYRSTYRAELPPLDVGAYRLVDRNQPGEAQAVLWITDDTPRPQ